MKKNWINLLCLAAAAVVVALIVISLSNYTKAEFAANPDDYSIALPEIKIAETAAETTSQTKPSASSAAETTSALTLDGLMEITTPSVKYVYINASGGSYSSSVSAPSAVSGTFDFPDGIYSGYGEGYNVDYGITAAVVIKNKKIDKIIILDEAESAEYIAKASSILDSIVSAQSTSVDIISGATLSSRGIMEAVQDALDNAKASGEGESTENTQPIAVSEEPTTAKEEPSSKTTDEPATSGQDSPSVPESESAEQTQPAAPTEPETTESTSGYKDGVYTVRVTCRPDTWFQFAQYDADVTVTIEGGVITSLTGAPDVTSPDFQAENTTYFNRALNGTKKKPGLSAQLLEAQSAGELDAVSSATCSSKAIIEAINTALQSAGK